MSNLEELERALDYPWDKWTVFLHPAQRQLVERSYNGPARVSGSAGTGKTIVALHRAVFLARTNPDARVLLTTFSNTLSNALAAKLRRLIGNEPRLGERVEVHAMNAIARRLYTLNCGRPQIASRATIQPLLEEAAGAVQGHKFSLPFQMTEWEQVVDAWQVESWEAYRDVARLGRKTRLAEKQRVVLWSIFERVRSAMKAGGLVTYSDMFHRMASHLAQSAHKPFDFACVDEAQDLGVPQLRFLAALGEGGQTAFSLRVTWVSVSFSSPSHGRRSASMFGGAPPHCVSTTGRHTRSGCRPTACSAPTYPTWTAIRRTGRARFPCSMGRSRTSWFSIARRMKSRRWATGWLPGPRKASRRTKWASSFALKRR